MSNPMFNPKPNYSGVTIHILNPAVNVNPNICKNIPPKFDSVAALNIIKPIVTIINVLIILDHLNICLSLFTPTFL